jgi:transcriptional regulator with XRE-family HTH domain
MFKAVKYMKDVTTFLKEQKISQEELAGILSISRPTAAKILNGENDVTVAQVKILSEKFSVNLNDLINGTWGKQEIIFESKAVKSKKIKEDFRISIPFENVEKFKNMFLYIVEKIGAMPNVGQTFLYKMLYFCDFDYYEKFEEQLTGAKYVKNHFGPTPKKVFFDKIISELESAGKLETVKSKYFDKEQTKYLPKVSADISFFSAQQIKHIDEEILRFKDKTAAWISDFSHQDVPWIMTDMNDVIDYESVFYRTDKTSTREYEHIKL